MTAPLIVPLRGRHVRNRHYDPKLAPYVPRAAVIGSAIQLPTDKLGPGLGLAIEATVGAWHRVDVGRGLRCC